MVVILENADEADRAKSALGMVRFADQDLVVLSGQRLLRAHETFQAHRTLI